MLPPTERSLCDIWDYDFEIIKRGVIVTYTDFDEM